MSAKADTVQLKNGDRLTGTAVKIEGGKLIFKTAYAADPIAISWSEVSDVKVATAMVLVTKQERLEVSELEATATGVIATGTKGAKPIDAASVVSLHTTAEQATLDKAEHPGWDRAWVVAVGANFGLASAASSSEQIGANMTAVRATKTDKTTLNFGTLYGRSNASGKYVDTADMVTGGLRYDHNVSPKFFYFGAANFLNDELQYLDLRTALNGGMGWHAYGKKKQTLDIFAGGGWTHESYSGIPDVGAETNKFANFDAGENYLAKIGKSSALTESLSFYPVLSGSNQGNYQLQFSAGYVTKIARFLNWTTNFGDSYTSFPPAGVKASSISFTTGIGLAWTRK